MSGQPGKSGQTDKDKDTWQRDDDMSQGGQGGQSGKTGKPDSGSSGKH
jgi:hypothetical protein